MYTAIWKKWSWILVLVFSVDTVMTQDAPAAGDTDKRIRIWYGDQQRFGHLGEPQRWINVLGHITEPEEVDSATFSINGRGERFLTLGGDLHRLALPGDFNVELSWEEVDEGSNKLVIIAYPKKGRPVSKKMTFHVEKNRTWPLPYYVDFSEVENLQEAVQVVDGHWRLEEGGARTVQRYYDRVLTMGDTTWKNFETTVRLTIHDFTPSEPGPPTYNVTHFGVAMRWRGHHRDGRQPSRKWFPLGAQGEFLLKEDPDSCRWRILFDGIPEKPRKYSDQYNELALGRPMFVKTQVATMDDGRTRYRFKQWMDGAPEPLAWDVEGFEIGDYPSGALCLVPHNSDVTIHEVRVEPLIQPANQYSARPGPGAIHFSAPVGGTSGARGKPFQVDFLQPHTRLLAVQVNLASPRLNLVRGFRFRIEDEDRTTREVLIGSAEGAWQPWFEIPDGERLTGVSGATGWFFDAIQFHFENGIRSPRYGGTGGDTTFDLRLSPNNPGRIRGFHGTYTENGLETLGLIFDPAD